MRIKMGMMAGEGDRGISGDYFEIRKGNTWERLSHGGNSTGNFFNSSVFTGGNTRNPNLVNNTGVDIAMFEVPNANNAVIGNSATSTKFRYGSTQDTYVIFNIVLAVDAYVPEVEPLNVLSAVNGAAHIPGSPLPVLEPGDEITYQLDIRNIGSEAVNGAKVVIPIPYTTEYVSAGPYSKDNSVTRGALQPVYDPITSTLTWDLGNLPWTANPDPTNTLDIQTILASMTYTLKVTEDCMFLSNAECIPVVEVKGRVEGTGAVSGVTLGGGGDFISGYNENVDCEQDPIRDPITLAIDVGDHCDDYTVESIEFKFCEGSVS